MSGAVWDMVMVLGDFNGRLVRLAKGVSGRFCVHRHADEVGRALTKLMRERKLFAASTAFQPRKRRRSKLGNATYIMDKAGTSGQPPAQIDYVLVSRRWMSSVRRCQVDWTLPIQQYKRRSDHGMVVAYIRQPVRKKPD